MNNYKGDANDSPLATLLLSDEAQARGLSVDELILLIKQKIDLMYQRLGLLAGVSISATTMINDAADFAAADSAYDEIAAVVAEV